VVLKDWTDTAPFKAITHKSNNVAEYEPGKFYKRELPCILGMINSHNLNPSHIIVDGHVYLDGHSRPGLGAYLYEALNRSCPVIGAAKSQFKDMPDVHALLRGQSQKPLWITSAGMEFKEAQKWVAAMAGPHRLPDMIKRADQLARGN